MVKLKYHYLGIPTKRELPQEDYIPEYKVYASGYDESPYGIEWMKFEDGSDLPELVKTVPHVAFVVDDINEAIKGKEILIKSNSPSKGLTVAFIIDNGAPIELLQFDNKADEIKNYSNCSNRSQCCNSKGEVGRIKKEIISQLKWIVDSRRKLILVEVTEL